MLKNNLMRRAVKTFVAMIAVAGALTTGWSSAAPAASASPNQPMADQYYQIVAEHNGECLMTRSWTHAEQVVTRPCQGSSYSYQWWKFEAAGGGYYRIINAYNDMCLDVAYVSQADWASVVQAGCWGDDNQLWRKNFKPDGYFELIAKHSQKCLDISWGWAIQYGCTNNTNERFILR